MGSWTYDKEKGDKLSFLFTKPVNKSKYHIEIIKNQIINITTYILLMFLLSMVIYSIFSGVGELNLPIVKYNGLSPDKNSSVINQSKYYSFMNLSTYILKYVFALILVAIFIGSVTNILSLYVDKTINLYICTFIFLGLGILLVNMIDMDIIQLILPFGYLNPSKVRTGEIIVKYGNSNMTYLMGIVSLIGWSIINNIFSFIILDDKL